MRADIPEPGRVNGHRRPDTAAQIVFRPGFDKPNRRRGTGAAETTRREHAATAAGLAVAFNPAELPEGVEVGDFDGPLHETMRELSDARSADLEAGAAGADPAPAIVTGGTIMTPNLPALTVEALTIQDGEARVRDLLLAERLGFRETRAIRKLILRNRQELSAYGEVWDTPSQTSEVGGRPGTEYHLNEAQALLVCTFARTPNAAALRKQLVDVFLAWRRGQLVDAALLREGDPAVPDKLDGVLSALVLMMDRFGRIADRLDAMAEAGAVAPSRAALPPPGAAMAEADPPAESALDVALSRFLAARVRSATAGVVQAAEMHAAFAQWCDALDLAPPSAKALNAMMTERGFESHKSSVVRWMRVRLVAAPLPRRPQAEMSHPPSDPSPRTPDPSHVLYGYDAIGRFLNMTAQQARNRILASETPAPVFRVGRKIAARPESLDAWFRAMEARGLGGEP